MEKVAVLRRIDGVHRRAEDPAARVLKSARNVERGLPAELHDDAERLLGLVDLKDVLDRDGLEVKLVGNVISGINEKYSTIKDSFAQRFDRYL